MGQDREPDVVAGGEVGAKRRREGRDLGQITDLLAVERVIDLPGSKFRLAFAERLLKLGDLHAE
jgi:hypothetical protein